MITDIKLIIIFIIVFLVLDIMWLMFFSKIFNPLITKILKKYEE